MTILEMQLQLALANAAHWRAVAESGAYKFPEFEVPGFCAWQEPERKLQEIIRISARYLEQAGDLISEIARSPARRQ